MNDEVDRSVTNLCSTLYKCARASKVCTDAVHLDTQKSRWERLLESDDNDQVWRAINWRGELGQSPTPNSQQPPDDQF